MVPEVFSLELHSAQIAIEVESLKQKSKFDQYANKRVTAFIEELNNLCSAILSKDMSAFDDSQKETTKDVLLFVSRCVQYIKESTNKDLDIEMYTCLRAALEEWTQNIPNHMPEDFIMATYRADVDTHYYYPFSFNDQLEKDIKSIFAHSFSIRLIPLGYPSYLEKDYLSNVSLYHELGHFIDIHEWGISCALSSYISKNKCLPMHDDYFEKINEAILYNPSDKGYSTEVIRLRSYLQEYFADIFAAQYVGESKIYLAEYMGGDNGYSDTHPSTSARTNAVMTFLSKGTADDFIKLLDWATYSMTKRHLQARNSPLDIGIMKSKKSYEIKDKKELHSLFHNAWTIWKDDTDYKKTPEGKIDLVGAYKALTRDIKQSIAYFEANK